MLIWKENMHVYTYTELVYTECTDFMQLCILYFVNWKVLHRKTVHYFKKHKWIFKERQVSWFERKWPPIVSHLLIFGPQLRELFGKDYEARQCWRRYVTGSYLRGLNSQCHSQTSLSCACGPKCKISVAAQVSCLPCYCHALHHSIHGL